MFACVLLDGSVCVRVCAWVCVCVCVYVRRGGKMDCEVCVAQWRIKDGSHHKHHLYSTLGGS